MKAIAMALLLVPAVLFAWEGEDPPELEDALRTGVYEISDIVVRYVPSSKQNGDAWDPFRGKPDLYLVVFIDDGSGLDRVGTTRAIENAGSTASWSGLSPFLICGPEEFSGPEVQSITFKIWDSDTYDPDFVDSGEISTSDLINAAENTVECNYGSEITFQLEWVGMQ